MIRQITEGAYETKHELKFIDYIAGPQLRAKDIRLTKTERKERVRNYINSCYRRKDWGLIDANKCELHAQRVLASI